jgi:Sulfatase
VVRGATVLTLVALAAATSGCACAGEDDGGGDERPPVVVLILDEFPTDDLLGPDGRIDAARYPNFARLASMSTWFPNGHTVHDSTFGAVPAILDARLPAPRTAADVRSHQPSVYHLMDRLGYEVHKVESATAICPPRICPGTRTRRPGVIDRLKGSGRPARLHRWIGSIRRRERPAFYLHHALLPHEPWVYLPSGRASRPSGGEPISGINLPWGFGDVWLSRHHHVRHLLQVGYTDRELGRLLDRLRRTKLLHDSLIVVVADHGYGFDIGAPSRRFVSEANVDEVAPVPFFVKAPGQSEGEVDDSFVRNLDVVPTIADLLGERLWWRHDGRSVFGEEAPERDRLVIGTRDFEAEIRIGREELDQRRAANRRRWAALFGTGSQSRRLFGDPWASVYRAGPNAHLLDRRVAGAAADDAQPASARGARALRAPLAVDRALATNVRAEVAHGHLVRDVSAGDPVLPTRVAGTLAGAPDEGVRDLAVAVNGRIRAVGRSFRLGTRPAEFFSFVVPERSLRLGPNTIELFEVRRAGRTLVPLGGVDQGPSSAYGAAR